MDCVKRKLLCPFLIQWHKEVRDGYPSYAIRTPKSYKRCAMVRVTRMRIKKSPHTSAKTSGVSCTHFFARLSATGGPCSALMNSRTQPCHSLIVRP